MKASLVAAVLIVYEYSGDNHMGKLARQGIAFGKKTFIDPSSFAKDEVQSANVIERILIASGWGSELEALRDGELLSDFSLHRLISSASISELLKFIEIRYGRLEPCRPLPAAVLPFGDWLRTKGLNSAMSLAEEFVSSLPQEDVRIVLDDTSLCDISDSLFPLLEQVKATRKDVLVIGPSVEEIVNWTSSPDAQSHSGVQEIFAQLGKAGLLRLRPSSNLQLIELASKFGLSATVVSTLDSFRSDADFASELRRIEKLAQGIDSPLIWCPVYSTKALSKMVQGIVDIQLLRAIAIGTLAMPSVQKRRASPRHISYRGLRLSHCFGANELGIGALDGETSEHLEVELYDNYCSRLEFGKQMGLAQA